MSARADPPSPPAATPPGHVRLVLLELRAWRPTLARMRGLLRSAVTSFIVLAGTLWLMPGVDANGLSAVLWLVLLVACVGALLRPLLLALATVLGGLGALLTGASVQTIVFYVALRLSPDAHLSGLPAAFAASWIAVALAAIVNWLADSGTDDAFLTEARRLMRKVRRGTGRRGMPPAGDGLLIVQLDGVSAPLLQWAVRAGNLPNIGRWLRLRSHRLSTWHTGLPATTPAAQAGILHGDARPVPAFRWYEKETGRLMVANRPRDAAEIERRLSNGRGLLHDGGVSISNVFSGDASATLFTVSRAGLPGRSTRGYAAFMTSPYGFTRAIVLGLGRVLKELHQARAQRLRDLRPRVGRYGAFLALRPLANMLRDVNVSLIAEQMALGTPVIFCDFVDYDEVAHHAGPARPEALEALGRLDQVLGVVQRLSVEAERHYHLVVLSDHGQSQGATFRQRFGEPLPRVVDRLTEAAAEAAGNGATAAAAEAAGNGAADPGEIIATGVTATSEAAAGNGVAHRSGAATGDPAGTGTARKGRRRSSIPAQVGSAAATAPVEAWGPVNTLLTEITARPGARAAATRAAVRFRTADRQVTLGPAHEEARRAAATEAESVVVASGNLAMVYFTRHPSKLTRAEIDAAYPGLVSGLAAHPGIGLVVVGGDAGPVAIGHQGEHSLSDGRVTGDDPLAAYDPYARLDLLRHQEMEHVGDLVLISSVDAGLEEVAAFEELVGSHGGLGGWQTEAFLLHPADWPVVEGALVGPERVHEQLVAWQHRLGLRGEPAPDREPAAANPDQEPPGGKRDRQPPSGKQDRQPPAAGGVPGGGRSGSGTPPDHSDDLRDQDNHEHRDQDSLPGLREDGAAHDADAGVDQRPQRARRRVGQREAPPVQPGQSDREQYRDPAAGQQPGHQQNRYLPVAQPRGESVEALPAADPPQPPGQLLTAQPAGHVGDGVADVRADRAGEDDRGHDDRVLVEGERRGGADRGPGRHDG